MKQIKFSLPIQEVEEGAPAQMGLTFTPYLSNIIHLNPGDTALITLRDQATGWYEDWTDEDIITYYDSHYAEYGLKTEVIADGPNFP